MIKLPLASIRGDNGPGITVDLIEDVNIYLDFEPEGVSETGNSRLLNADEARALAAMLVHFADDFANGTFLVGQTVVPASVSFEVHDDGLAF